MYDHKEVCNAALTFQKLHNSVWSTSMHVVCQAQESHQALTKLHKVVYIFLSSESLQLLVLKPINRHITKYQDHIMHYVVQCC